jgi:macrolide transport system ATP-binding/permease protein
MNPTSHWLRTIWSRILAAMSWDRLDREFDEELTTHLELLVEEERHKGMSPADARREAMRRLGRPERLRETHREQRGLHMSDRLMQDLKYSVRMLLKSPAFTGIVTLSLALGIGANTALFSLVDDLLLRSLPVHQPERLVQVRQVALALGFRKPLDAFPAAAFETMRSHNDALSDIVGFARLDRPTVTVDGGPESGREVDRVSANFFRDLGVTPIVGRAPVPTDHDVAIVSFGWWQARFDGSSSALGRLVTVNGQTCEIIGVAPPRFHSLSIDYAPDLWISSPPAAPLQMVARIKPGVTSARAQISTDVILRQLALIPPEMATETELLPAGKGLSQLRGRYGRSLVALTALVGLVLLITCTNVGNLLTVRNAARRRERTVRAALGATRARILSQYLVESLILAAIGGIVALVFARWGVTMLLSMLPLSAVPEPLTFQADARVLGFATLLSLFCALLFGLAPAWRATDVDLTGLRSSTGSSATTSVRRLGRLLVACQVGLSVLLLVGAGLFLQTLRNLTHVDVGFNPDNLLQVSIDTRGAGYREGQVGNVYRLLLERVVAIPGVASVTAVRNPVMRHSLSRGMMRLPGLTTSPGDFWDSADVGPSFFETLGIPVLRGRTFAPADFEAQHGFVVNEAWVKRYFPHDDPVARGIGIIGVVGNARLAGVRIDSAPMVFHMIRTEPDRVGALEVRTVADPTAIAAAIRDELRRVNARLFVEVSTMRQEIERDIATERMVAGTSAFFGVLGLLLVSIGIFGVASYTVAQRTNELGIRMALGAGPWSVIRESLRDTMLIFCSGLAAGTIAAVAAVRLAAGFISDLLFGLTATDVANIAAAVLVMVAVAVAACILPARHATRIDPLAAIRHE